MNAQEAIEYLDNHIDKYNNGTIDVLEYHKKVEAISVVLKAVKFFHEEITEYGDNTMVTIPKDGMVLKFADYFEEWGIEVES